MNRTVVSLGATCAAVWLLVLTAFGAGQQPTAVSHASNFAAPRLDVLEDGEVVISFEAAGDLQGVLTLKLRQSDTGLYAGEWAFMVAHVDNTDPETGLEPPIDDHGHHADDSPGAGETPSHGEEPHHGDEPQPHKDFVRMVHRGALAGPVTDAVVVFDEAGALADLTVPLSIGQGSLEFDGATGSGQATLAGLTLVF